jgi:hypothetical protein
VEHPRVAEAQVELDDVERRFIRKAVEVNISSADRRRWYIVFPDHKVGFMAHWNKRRKALRDWARKWGPELKSLGFRIGSYNSRDFALMPEPVFVIEEIPAEPGDDDVPAQPEMGKSIIFIAPKPSRSKHLNKRLPE